MEVKRPETRVFLLNKVFTFEKSNQDIRQKKAYDIIIGLKMNI